MGIRGYTKNYKLIKPEYNTDTWHDYEYDNLDTIDAVLSAIYASGDWQGFWKNNTSYKAGSVVIDQDTDTMYKVVADHTTDGNVTFAEYMFNHPEYYQLWSPNNLAKDWAIKDDGLADNQDYSAKAYAVGGVGTETNNAKYYSEQAGIQAEASAEQAAASASSATASYNSEQLALSHANQAASSAASSLTGAEQSVASAAISQEKAEYAANSVAGLESFVQEKQNEISASLAEAIKASEDAKKYAIEASSVSVGNIFYTSRLDNELNGAVEANGAEYNVNAFTGEQSVPSLLANGKLPYVSMAEYESIVSANGSCRAFGWDNGDTFRVPTLKDVYLMAGQAETVGEFISESLPNTSGSFQGMRNRFFLQATSGAFGSLTEQNDANKIQQTGETLSEKQTYWMARFNASRSSSTYQNGAKVRPDNVRYRAMVQISTGVKEDAAQLKEYKFNNPHFFGESKWTDVDPNNASWLVSNGSFHSGRAYVDYYKWLTNHIGETITANGGKIVTTNDEYADYDWVVNTSDETFRLPLLNGSEDLPDYEQQIDNVITGTINSTGQTYTAPKNGVFYQQVNTTRGHAVGVTVNNTLQQHLYEGGDTSGYSTGFNVEVRKGDVIKLYIAYGSDTGRIEDCHFTPFKGNGTLYFYVGDTVQDPALINAGGVLDYFSKLDTVHCVVETFKSGSSWYRVYDDGWVEQGGQSASMTAVVLLKPYKDNDYSLVAIPIVYNDNAGTIGLEILSKYASDFNLRYRWNGAGTVGSPTYYWQACGYGA